MDHHTVIDECQKIIIHLLKDKSPECSILLAKNRVDETNVLKISNLAEENLPVQFAEIVKEAVYFLKEAVDELCIKYHNYALNIGKLYGFRYKVSMNDTDSLSPEGLEKAAYRFIPRHGSNPKIRTNYFKKYVSMWVRQNIQKSSPKVCIKDQNGVYNVNREVLSLNSSFNDGRSHIEQVTENLWGAGTVLKDPEAMEELRRTYCSHLTIEEMMEIITYTESGSQI